MGGGRYAVGHPHTKNPTRYELDFIQTCFYGFAGGLSYRSKISEIERLLNLPIGGCFCPHCEGEAEKQGIDFGQVKSRLRWIVAGHNHSDHKQAFELNLLRSSSATASQLFAEIPEFFAWFKFRCDSFTGFWREIYRAAHNARPDIDVRFNDCFVYPEMIGYNLRNMSPFFDSIRSADYLEQDGNPDLMDLKRIPE